MKKKHQATTIGQGSQGEIMALTNEQLAISNRKDLWEKDVDALTDLALETEDKALRITIVKIISYKDMYANRSELDKRRDRLNVSLTALGAYVSNFFAEHGETLALIHAHENKERQAQGQDPKDSSSLSLFSAKAIVFKVDKVDYPVTLNANVTLSQGIGARALKQINKDAAWRLYHAQKARERDEQIARKWAEYEENEIEQADRW